LPPQEIDPVSREAEQLTPAKTGTGRHDHCHPQMVRDAVREGKGLLVREGHDRCAVHLRESCAPAYKNSAMLSSLSRPMAEEARETLRARR
jgi:hypothetical protein